MWSYSGWSGGGRSRIFPLGSSPFCSILPLTIVFPEVPLRSSRSRLEFLKASVEPPDPLHSWIKVKYLLFISNASWRVRPSVTEPFMVHLSTPEEQLLIRRSYLLLWCSHSWVSTLAFALLVLYLYLTHSTVPASVNLVSIKNQCLTHINLSWIGLDFQWYQSRI